MITAIDPARIPVHDRLPWDVDIRATGAALGRIMLALVTVDGYFTDSCVVGSRPIALPSRTASVLLRVLIPVGKEDEFTRIACTELKAPPRVDPGICYTDEEISDG